jgi:hypothetical protein
MNIKNMGKGPILDDATTLIKIKLNSWIMSKMYVNGDIRYSRLNKDGNPIIGLNVSEKIADAIYPKHLEFTVINSSLYPTIPLKALCDL